MPEDDPDGVEAPSVRNLYILYRESYRKSESLEWEGPVYIGGSVKF